LSVDPRREVVLLRVRRGDRDTIGSPDATRNRRNETRGDEERKYVACEQSNHGGEVYHSEVIFVFNFADDLRKIAPGNK
jgi:hypothetical protein